MTPLTISTSSPPLALAADYSLARAVFLEAARLRGGEVEHFIHPLKGPSNERLAVDVAEFGSANADSMLMIVSGTHGTEGYCGSALQTHWLNHILKAYQGDVRLVFVHALNPYGFAWMRRVNEDNVDLNRNFIDWAKPLPSNPGYDEIADLLVPESWSSQEQQRTTIALLERMKSGKMGAFQAAVTKGQYHHRTGLFFGGTSPSWSYRRLREICTSHRCGASRVAIVDIHSGLGEWGQAELVGHHRVDHPAHRRAVRWWGEVGSMVSGNSISAAVEGDWLARADDWFSGAEVTSAAIEYGTVDAMAVLQALRADAWLHSYGDPRGEEALAVRAAVRAAFADDDPAWIRATWARFVDVVDRALAGLVDRKAGEAL